MKRSQKKLLFAIGVLCAASAFGACGGSTNPESGYSALIAQSVPPALARGPVDQYTCGTGFVIQARGHGDATDLRFSSGQATSYTIELVKPLATPGMTFQLQAEGPQGSTFTPNDGSQDPQLAGTYNFTWTPPAAGQNSSGVSRALRVTLKKKGDESQLDPNVKNCLDKSVSPVEFNLPVDSAGQAFDVSIQWPDNSPVVQEGTSVPFTVTVTDETSSQGKQPHLQVLRLSNSGNELNAEEGSSFVTCADDSQAQGQTQTQAQSQSGGLQWIYQCQFLAKSGVTPKQASRHKTGQYVAGQTVVGYRILAQSADGKLKSDFNDRRTVILSAPQAGNKK